MQPFKHLKILLRVNANPINIHQLRTIRSSSRNGPPSSSRNNNRNLVGQHISSDILLSDDTTVPIQSQSTPESSELEIDWNVEMKKIQLEESKSVLAPILNEKDFDGDLITPYAKPSHNLAAVVKKSETLQKFIELGVDLHRIERKNGLAQFIVKLDFECDVKRHLQFLNDAGVNSDELGEVITKNPLIFKEDLENLATRVNYLQSKLFKPVQIARIVTKNPFWLMFRTQRIDARLGFYQKSFELSGPELRTVAVLQPKLITYKLEAIKQQSFSIKEEFGFNDSERKTLLLTAPKIWMMSKCFYYEYYVSNQLYSSQ